MSIADPDGGIVFRNALIALLLTFTLPAVAQDGASDVIGDPLDDELTTETGAVDTATAAEVATEPTEDSEDAYPNAIGRMPSLRGDSGLFRLITADGLPAQTIGLGMHGEYFTATDVVRAGDDNQRFVGTLTLSYAPLDFLEVFGSLSARGNANTYAEPELIQSLGDVQLGAKAYGQVADGFSLGGALGLVFLNSSDSVGLDFSSTSVDLRLLAGYALADLPLAFHTNLGVYIDNSPNLFQNSEGEILALQRVERFAHGVSDYHRFNFGLGVEVPVNYVTPFLEWNMSVPFGGDDLNACDTAVIPCPSDAGFSSWPDVLTLGVRGSPVSNLSLDLGVDIGLTSSEATGIPTQAPWNLIFGIAYNLDPNAAGEPETVYVEAAPPATGWVLGELVDAESSEAIAGALITYPGTEYTPQTTDPESGRFRSYEFPVDTEVEISISHPAYESRTFTRVVPEGQDGIRIRMNAMQGVGVISGTVTDSDGDALPAAVYLNDERIDVDPILGEYQHQADAGRYTVTVVAEGHVSDRQEVALEGQVTHDVSLNPLPEGQAAVLRGDGIGLSGERVEFEDDELTGASEELLDQVAALLSEYPDVRLSVEAHSDDSGSIEDTQEQAEMVIDYLVGAGVDGDRLEALGVGGERPRYPNISDRNRARNWRVEFVFAE